MSKERVLYWDVIKAFAIFMVVWGHSIQFLQPNQVRMWDSFAERLIVSVHMPLFMMVSGYFARAIYRKSVRENVVQKAKQLLLPSVSTFFVVGLALMAIRSTPPCEGMLNLLSYSLTSYWFLKALFIYYAVGSLTVWLWRKSPWFAPCLWLAVLGLFSFDFDFLHCIAMLPFFLAGMLLYRYETWFWQHSKMVVVVSMVIYLLFFNLFDIRTYSMYLCPVSMDVSSWAMMGVRTVIGLTSSLVCIVVIRFLVERFKNVRLVSKAAHVGTVTLWIYVFHREMEMFGQMVAQKVDVFSSVRDTSLEWLVYDLAFCLPMSVVFIVVCVITEWILKKNKWTSLIFLGK